MRPLHSTIDNNHLISVHEMLTSKECSVQKQLSRSAITTLKLYKHLQKERKYEQLWASPRTCSQRRNTQQNPFFLQRF